MEHSEYVSPRQEKDYLQAVNSSRKDLENLKKILSPPPPINKLKVLALAFLISLIQSQRHKRFYFQKFI
jgi:hypothetical protein